jgi:hypothetical protein
MSTANETAFTLLRNLIDSGFWGSLEIKFEAGTAVLVRKTETLKPNSGNRRSNRGDENGQG